MANQIFKNNSWLFDHMTKSMTLSLRVLFYVLVIFFSLSSVAQAFGLNQCASTRFGSDLVCTANDVSITGIAVAPGGPTSCVGGSNISVDLDVTVNFATPNRYDIGIFLVNDGKNPQLLPMNGGANTCSVSVLPTTLPFLNLDPGPWGGVLDTCGDGNSSINGGTGAGVFRMYGVPVACQAVNLSGGNLYIPFVVSWDNQSSPSGATCTSAADPVPNTKSKCNSPDVTVATQVAYGTVNLVVLPSIIKTDGLGVITAGDTVNYSIVITNTTGAALSGAVFTDPAVTNLTANSVSCTALGGAACPASLTVAAMQGPGIAIPTMPINSSVTFTVNATLSAFAPAGILTNTANVTVSGQTNSASDIDTVITRIGALKSFTPAAISVGNTSLLSVVLTNNNTGSATGVAFTDNYPANLANTATPGATNTCGGVVTAAPNGTSLSLSGGTIAAGSSCEITVNVTSSTGGSYNNITGAVTSNEYPGNSGSAILSVGASNLSTSTKTWEDQNGGDYNPGDVIRYTITMPETAGYGASGVSVTDTIPATLTGMTIVNCPGGATCTVAGQTLTVTNVTVTANGIASVVFDATIVPGTPYGTVINNCATITNPGGTGAAPCTSPMVVSLYSMPSTGNKPLYLYDSTSVPAYKISRAKPAGVPATILLSKGTSRLWTLSPALLSPVTVSTVSGNIQVGLYLAADSNNASRPVQVNLACSGGGTTYTVTQTVTLNTTPALRTFILPITANQTCAAGQTWNLTIFNTSSGGGTKDVIVYPVSGGNYSNVSLPSQNVINVDSVNSYNAAYPAVTTPPAGYYTAGDTVYVRAVVSDPFGSFDITSAKLTIKDPFGVNVVVNAVMTQVADSGAATKTYEYVYTPVPSAGPTGWWETYVTAAEGTENNVTDTGLGSYKVVIYPSLTIAKSLQVFSDPINGVVSPKTIPGAEVDYTITVINSAVGTVDNNTTVIKDAIPANTGMCVSTVCNNPVIVWLCSAAPACGLTYVYATSVSYSNQPGGVAPFIYTPVPDASGYDPAVTGIRINPSGIFAGSAAAPFPAFSIKYRVKIK